MGMIVINYKQQLKKFLAILFLLMSSEFISLLVGSKYSGDVKGWWPLALIVFLIVYSLYSFLFVLIETINLKSWAYIIIYNSILTILLAVLGILYYIVEIDWASVNNGTKTLTFFQSTIRNDSTTFLLLGIFLFVHLMIVHKFNFVRGQKKEIIT